MTNISYLSPPAEEFLKRISGVTPVPFTGYGNDSDRKSYQEDQTVRMIRSGARKLQKALLGHQGGLFSGGALKTLDEIARDIHTAGLASSIDEAKDIAQSLEGVKIDCPQNRLFGLLRDYNYFLSITPVSNEKGKRKYSVGPEEM